MRAITAIFHLLIALYLRRISRSRSCGSGVLLTIDYGSNRQEKLWVERRDMSIGFPPVQGCPAGL